MNPDGSTTRRIMFVSHTCYLDTSNGATIASRSMMECLARRGFAAAAVTGTVLESAQRGDVETLLVAQGSKADTDGDRSSAGPLMSAGFPGALRGNVRGVDVLLHRSPITSLHEADESEIRGFLGLLDEAMARFRPEVVVTWGGDSLAQGIQQLV